MSDGGKGSKARPFSVTQDEYENRWNAIFQRDDVVSKSQAKRIATLEMADNTGIDKNEYQDILATEDCMTIEMPGTLGSAKLIFKDES